MNDAEIDDLSAAEWLQIRKDAAARIDPLTAEVTIEWGQGADPYGVKPNLPPECTQVGRNYFARNPNEEIWVSFHDLSESALKVIWERMEKGEVKDPFDPLMGDCAF
jgi:hypothetical protein